MFLQSHSFNLKHTDRKAAAATLVHVISTKYSWSRQVSTQAFKHRKTYINSGDSKQSTATPNTWPSLWDGLVHCLWVVR